MTIYSITLNKQDYAYSISYHCANDDITLDTNEEAKNSLKLAIGTLARAIREYASISKEYEIKIKTVHFGIEKKDNAINYTLTSTKTYPFKIINSNIKIKKAGKKETDIEATRGKLLLMISDLYSEVEKYLSGERAQQTLPLEEKGASQEENENIFSFDIFE